MSCSDLYVLLRWQLAYRGIMADRYLDELEKEKAEAAERRRDRITRPYGPRTSELVAEHEGEVVGWLREGPKRDDDRHETQAELWAGYVHPDAWRSGVGSALMTAALERLAIEGVHRSNAVGARGEGQGEALL
jgi:GNAT superfamily N-acetyltransferase